MPKSIDFVPNEEDDSCGSLYVNENSSPGLHPFDKFTANQLPFLEGKLKEYYQEMFKLSKRNAALAYFLFEHKHLTKKTKLEVVSIFTKFLK